MRMVYSFMLCTRNTQKVEYPKFIELWDSTIPEHKALSKWAGNPWVWVIEFEEVQF